MSEKKTIKGEALASKGEATVTVPAPVRAYTHRQMRVKLDRSASILGRRYRPGELVNTGVDVPDKNKDDLEEVGS